MALLAAFLDAGDASLTDWLQGEVFADAEIETAEPNPADVEGFNTYMERYRAGLAIERAAVEAI
ncbi:hypothetical protein [Tessaracoccus aquimaris]|uniref:hypothetical protein n=1 Tax=Tessaracoccus aquimaris TaxID=1332264 RepID=UPI001F2B869C|nr:hypothetical protein [Tessaracoccus aquimaris]